MSIVYDEYTEVVITHLNGLLSPYLSEMTPSSYDYLFPTRLSMSEMNTAASKGFFPSVVSLVPALWYCFLFGVARFVLTLIVFKPLAIFAMKIKMQEYTPIPELDACYSTFKDTKKGPNEQEVKKWHKSATNVNKLSLDDIRDYAWKRRRNYHANKKITKFVEAVWRFVFYAIFCVYGYNALFVPETAEWILDTNKHWRGWPLYGGEGGLSGTVKLYYMVELGSYLHQLMWTEVSRADSIEMIVHHVATICLIVLSWLTNFGRVGASILLLHDIADIFLESAKTFNYISKAKGGSRAWASPICDVSFAGFATVFLVSRLIIYPRYILNSVLVEAPIYLGPPWFGYWIFAALLILLQGLHVFWFYMICRMIYKMVTTGIDKDERSDVDSDDEEEEVVVEKKEKVTQSPPRRTSERKKTK